MNDQDPAKVFVTRESATSDGRGALHFYDCPHCKRGKNQQIDSVYTFWSRIETCQCCGKEMRVISMDSPSHPNTNNPHGK